MRAVLEGRGLCICAPGGRTLVDGLSLELGPRDRVAVVGRNGVGKSSLLEVLVGAREPSLGRIHRGGRIHYVPTDLPASVPGSPGEQRWRALRRAFAARAELLVLDEPSKDLDVGKVAQLRTWLERRRGALLVVSHDRRLLSGFDDFFVLSEGGGYHVGGGVDALLSELESRRTHAERRYLAGLRRHEQTERRNETVRRRRLRKKNLGRIHEVGRCPSRAALNRKRGYAQVSQGKRAVLQKERIAAARAWATAARRAMAVDLPLSMVIPAGVEADATVGRLEGVGAGIEGRTFFSGLTMTIGSERIGIEGDNGSGKTTLARILAGQMRPGQGRAVVDGTRVGYIAQGASNWRLETSLVEELGWRLGAGLDEIAARIRQHRFPLALAHRALSDLSSGERVRAALIAVLASGPPAMLVLDEPTPHLDLLGAESLARVLEAWPGGLVVVSHDAAFLARLRLDRRIRLAGR